MERVAAARGEITEIVGRPSSGRTSLLVACLRDVAQSGETAALVDTEETFDPASAVQAGVGAHAARARAHDDRGAPRAPRSARGVAVALVAGVSRFACVLVAHFAAAAVERCEPALREQPLAVLTQTANIKILADANAAARERDVRSGMTETEAAARCPTLVTRPHIEEHVAAARHALLEAALAVSPRIEDGGAGIVYVDTAGLERLIGDPEAIGRRLVHQARTVGLVARVGVAGSRTAARVAAASASVPVTVVAPGRERAA